MSNDDKVGYGNPPKHTQFPPGKSGNLKGRPKGHRNFKTDLKATLEEPVRVTENGKTKTLSTQQAAFSRLREKALKGDPRLLDRLLALAEIYNKEALADAAETALTASEQAILDDYVDRRRRLEQKPPASKQSDPLEIDKSEDDDDAWLN